MNKESADEELAEVTIISRIDPDRKYFLYPHRACTRTKVDQDPDMAEINKCRLSPKLQDSAALLIMEDGGRSLDNINLDSLKVSLRPFIRSFLKLMDGLQVLHDAGYVHFDIKLGNIVTNRSLNTRFIDFGFMRPHTQLRKDDGLYENEYYVWPFEVRFLNSRYEPAKIRMDAGYFNRYVIQRFRLFSDTEIHSKQQFPTEEALAEWRALHESMKSDPNPTASKILVGADVYGLGRAMAEIYNNMIGHIPRTDQQGKLVLRVGNPNALSSIPADKRNPQLEELSESWYFMTENMTHLSLSKRWTLKQATEFFRSQILPLIFRDIRVGASRKRTKRIKKSRRTRRRNFPRVG
jgi:serine/threonine protein kinase